MTSLELAVVRYGAEEWQAIAAVGTLLVAIIAAIVALLQVRESVRLRREQSRPYVVVFPERGPSLTVDLVVKNFGLTVAREVRLRWDRPVMIHWQGEPEVMELFDQLPVLVPGQEWRTVWDFRGQRIVNGELPHRVVVSFRDSTGKPLPEETFDIDTSHFLNEYRRDTKGLNEIAESIEKLARSTSRWTEGVSGLRVYTRDGDKRDEQVSESRNRTRTARVSADNPQEPSTAAGGKATRRSAPKREN